MACNIEKLANFSQEKKALIALCVDSYTGDITNYVADNVKTDSQSIDKQIRERLEKEVFKGEKFSYRTYEKHKNEIFEIIEAVLDQVIPYGWAGDPFFEEFVDERRVDLGDLNEFYVGSNSVYTVSRFSGNHWDTVRERIENGAPIQIPTYWHVVHAYNEFERFFKGLDSFAVMVNKVYESYAKFFRQSIYTAFSGIAEFVPDEFSDHGTLSTDTERDALLTLAEKVEAYNGEKPMFIGSTTALRRLQGRIEDAWVASSAKEERKSLGIVSAWEGYRLMALQQSFKPGTFDFEIATDKILIASANTKPVKFVYEGNTRIKDVQDYRENMDMTLETQVHIKAGIGVVADGIVGEWTLA